MFIRLLHKILFMQHSNSQKAKIILQTIGQIIRTERENLQKSQRIFADEFDIQKSMLSRIENAVNEAKIISLFTISEALGIKLSDLIKKVEDELPQDFYLIEK